MSHRNVLSESLTRILENCSYVNRRVLLSSSEDVEDDWLSQTMAALFIEAEMRARHAPEDRRTALSESLTQVLEGCDELRRGALWEFARTTKDPWLAALFDALFIEVEMRRHRDDGVIADMERAVSTDLPDHHLLPPLPQHGGRLVVDGPDIGDVHIEFPGDTP